MTTNYTVDLNAGLSQVLADGSYTYLYGNSRLAQYGASGVEYFLTDALGSVRQVVDEDGAVILSKDYRPYGEALSSQGSGASSYGFAGEFTSSLTGQSYLRARWYAPGQGRFISRDTWEGEYSRPLSLNKWNYGFANPNRYTDPTGHIPYNREAVIRYARTHDGNHALDLAYIAEDGKKYQIFDYSQSGTLCTVYASYALWEAGVRDTREDPLLSGDSDYSDYSWWSKEAIRLDPINVNWRLKSYFVNEQNTSWSKPNSFYMFVTKSANVQATKVIETNYTLPQYFDDQMISGANDSDWKMQLAHALNNRSVMIGDLVFYDYKDGPEWDHVAIINGWGGQTYHSDANLFYCKKDNDCNCSDQKPRVIEKSGAIRYEAAGLTSSNSWEVGGRSIDNTISPIRNLVVLHLR